jgi:sugar-specific transcriptional regulator TrmB
LAVVSNGERILRGLGLTSLQARVYLVLLSLGESLTVREISKSSNVSRQDVYQVLRELQDLSLIVKEIDAISRFEAIPMQEALLILVKRRTKITSSLMAEAMELLQNFSTKEVKTKEDHSQMVLIPGKTVVRRRIAKAIETVEESLCVITPWRESVQWLCGLPELHQKILNRGAKVRHITGKPEEPVVCPKVLQNLLKHPNFQIRASTDPERSIGIYDNKAVFIATLAYSSAGESPALFTNNSNIVGILTSYFEMKWQLAIPYELRM